MVILLLQREACWTSWYCLTVGVFGALCSLFFADVLKERLKSLAPSAQLRPSCLLVCILLTLLLQTTAEAKPSSWCSAAWKRTDVVTPQQLFQRQSSLIKVKANFLHVTFPSTVLWAGPGGVNWGECSVCVDDEWWFCILSPQLSKELRGCQVIFCGWLLCL